MISLSNGQELQENYSNTSININDIPTSASNFLPTFSNSSNLIINTQQIKDDNRFSSSETAHFSSLASNSRKEITAENLDPIDGRRIGGEQKEQQFHPPFSSTYPPSHPSSPPSTPPGYRSVNGPATQIYKHFSIVFLTIQGACMPLLVRTVRGRPAEQAFSTTVNVLLLDVIKLACCALVLSVQRRSVFRFLGDCRRVLIGDPVETAKICVPSLIYTLQNNLYYVALTHLESATYLVLYQMRILLTAIFMRLALNKVLSAVQWLALCMLVAGIAVVQLQYEPSPAEKQRSPRGAESLNNAFLRQQNNATLHRNGRSNATVFETSQNLKHAADQQAIISPLDTNKLESSNKWVKQRNKKVLVKQNPTIGFLAVFTMCFTSALAGVYLELVMKRSSVSLFMQNIRLSLFGLAISTLAVFVNISSSGGSSSDDNSKSGGDAGVAIRNEDLASLFRGFDSLVWMMTFVNALGGLMVAVVIKYADNILKAYAQSVAIVGAAIGSWLLFDFVPSLAFLASTSVIFLSIYLYNSYPPGKVPPLFQKTITRTASRAIPATLINRFGRRISLEIGATTITKNVNKGKQDKRFNLDPNPNNSNMKNKSCSNDGKRNITTAPKNTTSSNSAIVGNVRLEYRPLMSATGENSSSDGAGASEEDCPGRSNAKYNNTNREQP